MAMSAETAAGVREVSNLDFSKLIMGPVKAIMDSQIYASTATVDFIRTYGFGGVGAMAMKSAGKAGNFIAGMTGLKAQMVHFEFEKEVEGKLRPFKVSVPFISLMPIPTMQITSANITFNMRINTMSSRSASADSSYEEGAGVGVSMPVGVAASSSGSYSTQKSTSSGFNKTSEFSMVVKLRIEGGEPLPGIAKLVEIMDRAIQEQIGWGKKEDSPEADSGDGGGAPASGAK